jgi:hypothetical protein
LPFTVGIGQDEDAVAFVGGTHVGRLKAVPDRIEPERGQPSENVTEPSAKESEGVLQKHESGSYHAKASGNFRPEPARVRLRLAAAGLAGGLAGEPGGHKVNGSVGGLEGMPVDLRDIAVAGHARPVALQHGGAVGVVLELGDDGDAVVLKGEV